MAIDTKTDSNGFRSLSHDTQITISITTELVLLNLHTPGRRDSHRSDICCQPITQPTATLRLLWSACPPPAFLWWHVVVCTHVSRRESNDTPASLPFHSLTRFIIIINYHNCQTGVKHIECAAPRGIGLRSLPGCQGACRRTTQVDSRLRQHLFQVSECGRYAELKRDCGGHLVGAFS